MVLRISPLGVNQAAMIGPSLSQKSTIVTGDCGSCRATGILMGPLGLLLGTSTALTGQSRGIGLNSLRRAAGLALYGAEGIWRACGIW